MKSTTVRVLSQGDWHSLGTAACRGVWAENVSLTADRGGPSVATLDLHRDPAYAWPDLAALAPVEIEVAGEVVWGGRIKEAPTSSDTYTVNVQCEGWQAHLDDDLLLRTYVHNRLADWKDIRSVPGADLTRFRQAGSVQTGDGTLLVGFPQGAQVIAGDLVGITIDLGPGRGAQVVCIDQEGTATNSNVQLQVSGYPEGGGSATGSATPLSTAASTVRSDLGAVCRTILIYAQQNAPDTHTNDSLFRLSGIRLFASTAYEAANQSALTASKVISDALTGAPALDQRASWISATTFAVPHLAPDGPQTPRELIASVQAFHDYTLQVDAAKRLRFAPKATAPTVRTGDWPGITVEDASAASSDDVYTKVLVTGQTPDGQPVVVTRTAVQPARSTPRAKELQVAAPLPGDQVAAAKIADVWLAAHITTPFKGSIKITGDACRLIGNDMPVGAERLLLLTDGLIRLDDRIDPDTGGCCREGRISQVVYTPATDEAQITIDDSRSDVDALLSRLAVVAGV